MAWYEAYLLHNLEISKNEISLFPATKHSWGGIEHVAFVVDNELSSIFENHLDVQEKNMNTKTDKYGIHVDLHCT